MNYLHNSTFHATEITDYYDNEGYNPTDDEDAFLYPVQHVVILCIPMAICVFGMVGNGIALWYLVFRIHRSPFTVYILNLAIADFTFLFIFSITLIFFFLDLHGVINEYDFLDNIEVFIMFGFDTSQFLLTAISVERCLSVLFPIWYRCHRPKYQSVIVCIVLWLLSCVISASSYFCDGYHICKFFSIFQAFLSFLILLPLMLLSNVALIIKILRRSRRQHPPRLYILIITTVLAFLILSLPLSLIIFLDEFDIFSLEHLGTAILFSCINSSINPVIYFLVGRLGKRRTRSSVTVTLQMAFQDESDPPHQ